MPPCRCGMLTIFQMVRDVYTYHSPILSEDRLHDVIEKLFDNVTAEQ